MTGWEPVYKLWLAGAGWLRSPSIPAWYNTPERPRRAGNCGGGIGERHLRWFEYHLVQSKHIDRPGLEYT